MSLRRKLGLKAGAYPPISAEAETTAWANAVVGHGGTVSSERHAIVNRYLSRLKAVGIYDRMDDINAWWGEDHVQARVSLKWHLLATPLNGPVFTANHSYAGDALSACLDTGFIPSTHCVAASLGNARIGSYVLTNVSGTKSVMGVALAGGGGLRLRPRGSSNLIGADVTAALIGFVDVVATSAGYTAAQRSGGSLTITGQRDAAALTDATAASGGSGLPTNSLYVLARNNAGSVSEPTDAQVGLTYIGAPLSLAQGLAHYAAVVAFGQAVGAIT